MAPPRRWTADDPDSPQIVSAVGTASGSASASATGSAGSSVRSAIGHAAGVGMASGSTPASSTNATYRVDAMLTGIPGWTSFGNDVIFNHAESLTWDMGMRDGGPNDRTAPPGQFKFSLANAPTGTDPTRLVGKYSPNSPNCRSGFGRGIYVRVVQTYRGADQTMWTGRLWSIFPVPGTRGLRVTRCTAYCPMKDFTETDIKQIATQTNKSEVELFAAVIAAMPTSAQPLATEFDSPLNTFPYAFDNLGGQSVKAMQLVSDVNGSVIGFLFPKKDGTVKYQNRQSRSRGTVTYAFSDSETTGIVVPSDLSKSFNRVRVTDHPRSLSADNTTVLYALTQPTVVHPGDTLTWQGDYRDQTNTLKFVGGTNFHTVDPGIDYAGNSTQSGLGHDYTGDLVVTMTPSASSVLISIYNPTGVAIWLVDTAGVPTLQLRGQAILDNSPRIFESYTPKDYGDRLLELSLKYSADTTTDLPQGMAQFLDAQYNDPSNQVFGISFLADRSDALMRQVRRGEIGDLVSVSETVNGITDVAVAINGIQCSLIERAGGPALSVTYITAPRGPAAAWILDDPISSILDTTTILGFV